MTENVCMLLRIDYIVSGIKKKAPAVGQLYKPIIDGDNDQILPY